jgi:hypothetical protein
MDPALLISTYGAVLSTALATLQIAKSYRDSRFVSVEATTHWTPKEDLWHDIWIMNRGGAAVTLREVMIGTAVREGIRRSIAAETMVSLLARDDSDEPLPVTLGPGEAKHFCYSAVNLRRDYLEYVKFRKDHGSYKATGSFHVLEIWHSRSKKHHYAVLDCKPLTEAELDELVLKKQDSPVQW